MVNRRLRRIRNASYIADLRLIRCTAQKTMRYAMSDLTSNRNDVASWRLHIPFEDVVAVVFGLTPSIIVFYLLTVN